MKQRLDLCKKILFLFYCFTLSGSIVAQGHTITGSVTGFVPNKPIFLALYASEVDFKAYKYYQKSVIKPDSVHGEKVSFNFSNVATGEYIIACFQDFNKDKKLNIGPFGPKEPYTVYLTHYNIFGPTFNKCKFFINKDMLNIVLFIH